MKKIILLLIILTTLLLIPQTTSAESNPFWENHLKCFTGEDTNGIYNSQCECSDGYVFYKGQCRPGLSYCKEVHGYMVNFDEKTDTCVCWERKIMHENQCVSKSTLEFYDSGSCPENAYSVDRNCGCDTDYRWADDWPRYCELVPDIYHRPTATIGIPRLSNYIIHNDKYIFSDREQPGSMIGAMVKGASDPKTYIVDADMKLRWIENEKVAFRLFGPNWDHFITWFSDAIIYTYEFGEPIGF